MVDISGFEKLGSAIKGRRQAGKERTFAEELRGADISTPSGTQELFAKGLELGAEKGLAGLTKLKKLNALDSPNALPQLLTDLQSQIFNTEDPNKKNLLKGRLNQVVDLMVKLKAKAGGGGGGGKGGKGIAGTEIFPFPDAKTRFQELKNREFQVIQAMKGTEDPGELNTLNDTLKGIRNAQITTAGSTSKEELNIFESRASEITGGLRLAEQISTRKRAPAAKQKRAITEKKNTAITEKKNTGSRSQRVGDIIKRNK